MPTEESSFSQLILSAILGSGITLLLKHLFEHHIQYHLHNRRSTDRLIKQTAKPLLNDGYKLERRINNFIRNIDKNWHQSSEYYRLTTNVTFYQYFSRLYTLDRQMSYLEHTNHKETNEFNKQIRKVYFTLSSMKLFEGVDGLYEDKIGLRRETITALGELMTICDDATCRPMTIVEFQKEKPTENVVVKMWEDEFETFLRSTSDQGKNAIFNKDRLIMLGKALHELNLYLDKSRIIVRNNTASNMDLIVHEKVKENYDENFPSPV